MKKLHFFSAQPGGGQPHEKSANTFCLIKKIYVILQLYCKIA